MKQKLLIILLLSFIFNSSILGEEKEKIITASGSMFNLASVYTTGSNGYSQNCLFELRYVDYGDPQKTLKYDLRDKYYGCMIYGPTQLHLLYEKLDTEYHHVVLFLSRRGGDGDHSPTSLQAFKISDSKIKLIGEIQVTNPSVNILWRKLIVNGFQTFTFCSVCDGWEVSEPEDIFQVPISIEVNDSDFSISPWSIEFNKSQTILRFKNRMKSRLSKIGNNTRRKEYYKELETNFYHSIGLNNP